MNLSLIHLLTAVIKLLDGDISTKIINIETDLEPGHNLTFTKCWHLIKLKKVACKVKSKRNNTLIQT